MLPAALQAEYPFTSRWADFPFGRLHYVDEGAPRAGQRPIVCLHGNPSWSWLYRHLIRDLAPQRRILALDHLGMGLSDKPEPGPYRLAERIAQFGAWLDRLGLREVDLVVHDWGGAIGLGWAARHPERVGAMLVLNTAAFLSPHLPKRIALCRTPGFRPWLIRGADAFAGGATLQAVARPMSAVVRAGFRFPYRTWRERVAVQAFVDDIPMASNHPTWATLEEGARLLENLRGKRVHYAWGMRDWCFTPKFLAGMRERLPGPATEIDTAGHYVTEDAPREVALAASVVFGL